ncbi:MFS transporter, partial [Candidatus Bathyarchaeota archaeon]|nr:MFS transporter [Candidatus Bathyarchaeota archaeon]
MFAAETAPPRLRGALVAQWQIWTAFGIMVSEQPSPSPVHPRPEAGLLLLTGPLKCGYAADLALYKVEDVGGIEGLNWRLMLASAALPALLCLCLIWTIPESPRWLMSKGRYRLAYQSMCALRFKDVQAARDLFYADALMKAEYTVARRSHVKELFTVRRNRNAFIGSEIVMFMQQFCGSYPPPLS